MSKNTAKKLIAGITAIVMLLILAACAASPTTTATTTNATTKATTTPTTESEPTENLDPLGKYDPPITLTACMYAAPDMKFAEGESLDNNVWTKEYASVLGITVKFEWMTDFDNYSTKLNLNMASGTLPDLIQATIPGDYVKLAEAGLIVDLTDAFNNYASDLLKDNLGQFQQGFESTKINGRLMAIPHYINPAVQANVIWTRDDWMKKLNLSAPKTFEDVINIAKAFTTQDPDGNGKADTYGLGVCQDFLTNTFDLSGVFNAFHCNAGPGSKGDFWMKDANGKLVYALIQPETKTALKVVQGLYKDGLIDPEFAVKDAGKVAEDLTNGKIGLLYGANWNGYWPFADLAAKSNVTWTPHPYVSADEQPVIATAGWGGIMYHSVNKNCKYPEALVKMDNLYQDRVFGPDADPAKYQTTPDGIALANYTFIHTPPAQKDFLNAVEIHDALQSGDDSKVTRPEAKNNYTMIKKYLDSGDMTGWAYLAQANALYIMKTALDNNQILLTGQLGPDTPLQAKYKPSLQKMQIDVFTRIIMGESIDEFDKFVTDWKSLGGDEITEEVNSIYNK